MGESMDVVSETSRDSVLQKIEEKDKIEKEIEALMGVLSTVSSLVVCHNQISPK